MTSKRRVTAPAAARASAAARKARSQREREARSAAAKAARRASREKHGRLRDKIVRQATIRRYKAHVKEFFHWVRATGRRLPDDVSDFDALLCSWAENLWSEGEQKSLLNNGLCGLAHFTPALRGKLNGAWRVYKAWGRLEKPVQAPPLPKRAAQALAGWFHSKGHRHAATMILVAHHCILRSNEFFDLRTGDVTPARGALLLTLRDTKMVSAWG